MAHQGAISRTVPPVSSRSVRSTRSRNALSPEAVIDWAPVPSEPSTQFITYFDQALALTGVIPDQLSPLARPQLPPAIIKRLSNSTL